MVIWFPFFFHVHQSLSEEESSLNSKKMPVREQIFINLEGTLIDLEGQNIVDWCDSLDLYPWIWPWGYKTFFLLNSVKYAIYPANKYQNTTNFNIFPAEQSWARNLSC